MNVSYAFNVGTKVKIKIDLFAAFLIISSPLAALVRRAATEDVRTQIFTEPNTCIKFKVLPIEDNLLDGPHIVFFD